MCIGLDHNLTVYKGTEQVLEFDWRKLNWFHAWWTIRHPDGDNGADDDIPGEIVLEFLTTCEKVVASLNKGTLESQNVPDGETWEHKDGKTVHTKHTRETVKFADTSVAEELMPPQAGFFFGSTVIEDYYYRSLENVIEQFKPIRDDLEANPETYRGSYSSWW